MSRVTTTYSRPVTVPVATAAEDTDSDSGYGWLMIVAFLVIVVALVLAITQSSHTQMEQAHILHSVPHAVHVPAPEIAYGSALGPLQAPYQPLAPYAIAPNAPCVPGSQYYPSCLTQTPVQYFTSGDPFCTAGSMYWPLCKDTAVHPLPAMRF
jgi:hypothetical protein